MTLLGQSTRSGFHLSALFLLSLTVALAVHAQDKMITAEELISRHLESVGPAEAREQLESRSYVGEGIWRLIAGGVGQFSEQVLFVSSKDMCDFSFDTRDNTVFFGERFGFDGEDTFVKRAFRTEYSVLGQFMVRNENILREGLLGGTANLSWALQDVAGRRAKVRYRGLKNVDGRSLHRLDYQPRKRRGNLKIELYFDPETYRHVRTEYREVFREGFGPGGGLFRKDPAITQDQDVRVSLIESFDNFQQADGVMLPALWNLKLNFYNESRTSGSAHVSEMEYVFQRVHHNEPIESR